MKRGNISISFFFLYLGVLGLTSFAHIIPQQGSKENDRITALPGQPRNFEFSQYAGNVVVNETLGSSLFYYFVEAAGPKNSKPLLLWLNGGPLVSSLVGLMEHGPYRVSSDGKTLFENIYSWNKVANVLYLETPVGVGFSYCNTTAELKSNSDPKTAEMNYIFLLNWLERFPQYKHRDLYIAGQSYAGHYVPQLAQTIVQSTAQGNHATTLKGILVGNPTLDPDSESFAQEEFFGAHNMISPGLYKKIRKQCILNPSPPVEECTLLKYACMAERGTEIIVYNVLAPLCNSTVTAKPKPFSIEKFDPCTFGYLEAYINSPEVRRAIHAPAFVSEWIPSSVFDKADYKDNIVSMLPIIKDLLNHKIRVLIYSGDLDAKNPTAATLKAVNKLNVPEEKPWKAWHISEGDAYGTGGYRVEYEGGLTFATVRGAGHGVGRDQPARALELVGSFLAGKGAPW